MPNTPPDACSVLVVGLGPVGLLVAALLRRYGVDAAGVERAVAPPAEPRAAVLDDEALRALGAAGVAGAVTAAGIVQAGAQLRLLDGRAVTLLNASPKTANGHPELLGLDQARLEAELASRVHGAAFAGWTLTSLTDTGDGVVAGLVAEDGARHAIAADWVVGADGAGSAVRRLRGIEFTGTTFAQEWLVVDAMAAPNPGPPMVTFVGDPAAPGVRLQLTPAIRRAEVMVPPGTRADPRLAARLAGPDAEPLRASVYTFHARTAARWRDGRVLLAGDAAHVMPPFAGQGLSAGLRDAVNLAWKLAAAVHGTLEPTLLDTYEAERRPHVLRMTALARFVGALVQTRRAGLARARDLVLRAADATPAAPYLQSGAPKPRARLPHGPLVRPGRGAGELIPQPDAGDASLGDGFAIVRLAEADPTVTRWLARRGAHTAVVRPDRHVLGVAQNARAAAALAAALPAV